MEIIEKGFAVNYELQKMGLIKVGGSGDYNGKKYSASLKIRCSNLVSREDETLGTVDNEELLEFKIPCESDFEASELNRLFRSLKSNGVVVTLNATLPIKNDEFYKSTVLDSAKNLIQKYHKDMKKAS